MAANPKRRQLWQGGPLSVEDYLRLDRSTPGARYEYLNGIARLMSGGSIEHDRIARNVANSIEKHVSSGPCAVFGSDVQVRLGMKADGREHYVYPDTTVSCDLFDRRRGNKLIRSPRIVVEVLSPSTERDDRGKKLSAYQASPTIQEIVLINQFAPHVEVYRRNEEDATTWSYVVYRPDEEVELSSVDIRLSMEEIYQYINFDEPLVEE